MANIIRTGIKTWFCLGDVQCNQPVPTIFINELNSNMKAVANTGTLACGMSNGNTHGRLRPFHGWAYGKNVILTTSLTSQMVELSDVYDSYVLEFEGKLADLGGGIGMQYANFFFTDPATGYNSSGTDRLGEIKLGASGSPIEFQVVYGQDVRVRIYGTLPTWVTALIPSGKTISLNLITKIYSNGGGVTKNITDSSHWSGILSAELKFFRSCP